MTSPGRGTAAAKAPGAGRRGGRRGRRWEPQGTRGQGPECEDLAGGGGSGAFLRGKLRVIEGFRADAGKDPADVSKESLQPLCSE